ncbi:MAG: ABC transporter permease [Cytophagales bacterium]|nr:ABC transporter permease [Cytophagales bacterium]
MIRSYLKTSLRNILKTKVFTLINILGLAVGMASCLLLIQYVYFENTYDTFHENVESIYRVPISYSGGFTSIGISAANHPALGPAMKRDFPEVMDFARVVPAALFSKSLALSYTNDSGEKISHNEEHIYLADSSFFSIFSFPLVAGAPSSALHQPQSIVISESLAKKYFRDVDPIGKNLVLGKQFSLLVTGVFQDIPENSHIKFDCLISFSTLGPQMDNNWKWPEYYTYVQLYPDADPKELESKFPEFIDKYLGEIHKEFDFQSHFSLQPLVDLHLRSNGTKEPRVTGDLKTLTFLKIIAFLILLIAWVNYVNLSSARSLERAKEVGYRKVAGASKFQLVIQFLVDSLLINSLALILAIALAIVCLPYFNELAGKKIGDTIVDLALLRDTRFWWGLFLITICGAVLAGLYPAWLLSSYRPTEVLKGRFSGSGSGIFLRKALVVFQIFASVCLIAGTLTVSKQLNFMRKKDLGYAKDQMLILKFPSIIDSTILVNANYFKNEIGRLTNVQAISNSSDIPGQLLGGNTIRKKETNQDDHVVTFLTMVDYEYFSTYQMDLIAGRNFRSDDSTNILTSINNRLIVNEKLVEILGYANPEDAIGKSVLFHFGPKENEGTIIGVVNNHNQRSLKEDYEAILYLYPRFIPWNYYSIHLSSNQISGTIAEIEARYKRIFAGNPFDFFFLDEYFDQQYRSDQQFQKVFTIFSVLAIFVALLGLFGLSTLMLAQRSKEISIRKVLGARISSIVLLLSKEFIKLIIIGGIIAAPAIFFWSTKWLSNFAFRVALDWSIFVIPTMLLFLISLITIGYQTIKAAIQNPVDALRQDL